ncbi:MAG: HAD family hydrolase [Acidimicrobiales bacterium]
MVEAVLVDVGGVLVMPDHGIVGAVAAAHGGAPSPAALDRGHYEGVAAGELPGGFDWAAYRRGLLAAGGVPADRVEAAGEALAGALAGPARGVWTRVLPGAVEGLRRLASSGLPVAVVSNSDGTVAAALAELGLTPGSGVVVDSGTVGITKPDPAIFRLALEALGVAAAGAVYVGDVPSVDVVGARAAGVEPLHVDPIGWCADGSHAHVRNLADVADRLVT